MATGSNKVLGFCIFVMAAFLVGGEGAGPESMLKRIMNINAKGPYVGVVVPNGYEMSPLLESTSFLPDPTLPYFDFSGHVYHPIDI
uniref:Uncharacterized protein n=1 Tax=Kalanchoe fedtschenkoi TaxID=63787 RepID=A0A7N0TU95_KALFE